MKSKWKIFKRKKENNRGVTLIETLVATVILALAVIPLMNSIVSAARINAKSRIQQERTTLCQTIMEQVKAKTLRGMYLDRLDLIFDSSVTTIDFAGHTLTDADCNAGVSCCGTAWYGATEYYVDGSQYHNSIVDTYTLKYKNVEGYYVLVHGSRDKNNTDGTVSVGYREYSKKGLSQYIQYNVTITLYETDADLQAGTNAVATYSGSARDYVFINYTAPDTP